MPDTDSHIKDSIVDLYISLIGDRAIRRNTPAFTYVEVSINIKDLSFILNTYQTFQDLNIEITNNLKFIAYNFWLKNDSIEDISFLINRNKAVTMAYINDIRGRLECHQKLLDKLTAKEAVDNADI